MNSLVLVLISLILSFSSTFAIAGEWIADGNIGCQVWNANPSPGESITWSGPCSNKLATGNGILQWYSNGTSGSRSEGQYLNGKLHGKGVVTWPNGSRYEGDFVDGQMHGKGAYSWPDGNRYEGDFVDGKRTGKGTFTWPNGDRYEGDFVDDKRKGKGAYTWSNGDHYEGDFDSGKLQGFGEKKYATSQVIKRGIWASGELAKNCNSSKDCATAKEDTLADWLPSGSKVMRSVVFPEYFSKYDLYYQRGHSARECKFSWPFDDDFYKKILNWHSRDGGAVLVWTGQCLNGLLEGSGSLIASEIPTTSKDLSIKPRSGWTTVYAKSVSFANGVQTGQVDSFKPLSGQQSDIAFAGNANNFWFEGVITAKGRVCNEIGWFSCKSAENIDKIFVWKGTKRHLSWFNDSDKSWSCSSEQRPDQCVWSAANYESTYKQYSSAMETGQCKLMDSIGSQLRSKGGHTLSRDDPQTCAGYAKFADVLSGRDAQAMYLAGARYENNNERTRAKRIYLTLMDKFPKSAVATNAADRLTRLSDVEAVESATSSAASASYNAAESVKRQNSDQCQKNRNACFSGCGVYKDYSQRNSCQSGCPMCAN